MTRSRYISFAIRFRILQRDNFTCQYCGAKPPEVVLQVDHIDPYSKGGANNAANLITACYPCNAGKRDSLLSPDQAAYFSGRELPDATPRPRPVQRARQSGRSRALPKPRFEIELVNGGQWTGRKAKLDEYPVAMDFVYVEADTFLAEFRCKTCGFVNRYEGDGCGCKRRAHETALEYVEEPSFTIWCSVCDEQPVDEDEDVCEDCRAKVGSE